MTRTTSGTRDRTFVLGREMVRAIVEQQAPPPAADQAGLAFFAGGWQAEGTFHATPFSARKPVWMSIVADVVHRGFWLQARTAEHPYAKDSDSVIVTCLGGYDTETGRFSAEWFDSNGDRASQTSAGWDDDRLVFTGRMSYGGCSLLRRDTFARRRYDEYHHRGEVYLGEEWVLVDEETARRSGV